MLRRPVETTGVKEAVWLSVVSASANLIVPEAVCGVLAVSLADRSAHSVKIVAWLPDVRRPRHLRLSNYTTNLKIDLTPGAA